MALFFDDKGTMYVNTTTAGLDTIKYSRQIDITRVIGVVVLKVNPRNGKILWSLEGFGPLVYVSGKFVYTGQSYDPGDSYGQNDLTLVLQRPPFLCIRRLSQKDGHVLWQYGQKRAPLDVQFGDKSIQLVFKKEVQVLRFFSF